MHRKHKMTFREISSSSCLSTLLNVRFTCSHMWGWAVSSQQESEGKQTNQFHWKNVCCCYDALHQKNNIQRRRDAWQKAENPIQLQLTAQHTGAIGFFHDTWTFCVHGLQSTFDMMASLCGSIVFVAVHWQILCELHMLLSLDGSSFTGPR